MKGIVVQNNCSAFVEEIPCKSKIVTSSMIGTGETLYLQSSLMENKPKNNFKNIFLGTL